MEIILSKFNKTLSYPVGEHVEIYVQWIKSIVPIVKKQLIDNQPVNILCTGSSGAILAGLLYNGLKLKDCKILHVKKEGESSHDTKNLKEKHSKRSNYFNIYIDDFVSSGDSLNRIYENMPNFQCNLLIVEEFQHVEKTSAEWTLDFYPDKLIVNKNKDKDYSLFSLEKNKSN